jgi:hypothetical protein
MLLGKRYRLSHVAVMDKHDAMVEWKLAEETSEFREKSSPKPLRPPSNSLETTRDWTWVCGKKPAYSLYHSRKAQMPPTTAFSFRYIPFDRVSLLPNNHMTCTIRTQINLRTVCSTFPYITHQYQDPTHSNLQDGEGTSSETSVLTYMTIWATSQTTQSKLPMAFRKLLPLWQ